MVARVVTIQIVYSYVVCRYIPTDAPWTFQQPLSISRRDQLGVGFKQYTVNFGYNDISLKTTYRL